MGLNTTGHVFIPQIRRLSIMYARKHPTSIGIRAWMNSSLEKFADRHRNVVISTHLVGNQRPLLVGEYICGSRHVMQISQQSESEIQKSIMKLMNRSGKKPTNSPKYQHTNKPSIQGWWNPFQVKHEFLSR